jgi:hypothetical protein
MRIPLTFIAGVLMISLSLISSANNSGAVVRVESQMKEALAVSRKAWPAFFAEFRAAVNRRDKDALRKLMAKDFNGQPQTPEGGFRQWDNPKIGGWLKLRRVLTKGAVLMGKPDEGDPEQERTTMLAPPAADGRGYYGNYRDKISRTTSVRDCDSVSLT